MTVGKKLFVEFFHYRPSRSLKGGRPTTPPPKSTDALEMPTFGCDSVKPLFILSCVTFLAENITAVYTEDTLKAVNKTQLIDPFLKLQDQANSNIDSLMTEMKYSISPLDGRASGDGQSRLSILSLRSSSLSSPSSSSSIESGRITLARISVSLTHEADQVDICEIFDFWMSWAIANQEYNFSTLSSEGGIKLSYPLFKKISNHPTFLLASTSARVLLNIFKASWCFVFANNKHG